MSESVADVVRTKQVELVNSEGKVRARLALDEEGVPGLSLCDEQGNTRATLLLDRRGMPRLTLLGKAGTVHGALEFGTEWKIGLMLIDRHQQVVWSAIRDTL